MRSNNRRVAWTQCSDVLVQIFLIWLIEVLLWISAITKTAQFFHSDPENLRFKIFSIWAWKKCDPFPHKSPKTKDLLRRAIKLFSKNKNRKKDASWTCWHTCKLQSHLTLVSTVLTVFWHLIWHQSLLLIMTKKWFQHFSKDTVDHWDGDGANTGFKCISRYVWRVLLHA